MNDKEMKNLSDLKLKSEIEQVGKKIDKAELDGVTPGENYVKFMARLNKEVERRANPEPEPQVEESK